MISIREAEIKAANIEKIFTRYFLYWVGKYCQVAGGPGGYNCASGHGTNCDG